MRSPEIFLGTVRRALFPPLDRRKLGFRGGWPGLPIYLVMILIYPASLAQAGWVDLNAQFTYIALAGAVLGTVVGNAPLRPPQSPLLASPSRPLPAATFT